VPPSNVTGSGTTGLTLDNVAFSGVKDGVVDSNGKVYLSGSTSSIDTWVLGPVYFASQSRQFSLGMSYASPREITLTTASNGLTGLPKQPYFERAKPQYETVSASQFVHVKDHGALGRSWPQWCSYSYANIRNRQRRS
jgi:hypothetical protein